MLYIILLAAGCPVPQAMARGQARHQGIYNICSLYRYIYIVFKSYITYIHCYILYY